MIDDELVERLVAETSLSESLGVEGVIVAGGDGTFAALSHVSDSIRVIGVPKTIDNDLSGTEIIQFQKLSRIL